MDEPAGLAFEGSVYINRGGVLLGAQCNSRVALSVAAAAVAAVVELLEERGAVDRDRVTTSVPPHPAPVVKVRAAAALRTLDRDPCRVMDGVTEGKGGREEAV